MTSAPGPSPGLAATLVRLAVLIAIIVTATWAAHVVRDALDLQIMPENEQAVHRAIMLGSAAYVGLLAIPFVPGAEIGIALLTAFGPPIAPLVYAATVTSMMLAYTLGRVLPPAALVRLLATLRLSRAARLVAEIAPLPPEDRLARLFASAPGRLSRRALRHRYLALAVAVNTPGNALVGGGGGLMMMAGLSGIFSPVSTFLTIAVAVAPVPLAVMFLGLRLG